MFLNSRIIKTVTENSFMTDLVKRNVEKNRLFTQRWGCDLSKVILTPSGEIVGLDFSARIAPVRGSLTHRFSRTSNRINQKFARITAPTQSVIKPSLNIDSQPNSIKYSRITKCSTST